MFQRKYLLIFFCISFCFISAWGEELLPLDKIKRQLFPIWEDDSNVYIAAEMSICAYPDNTLMSKIKSSSAKLDLAIPEHLIINEFELTLTADKESILANYYGNAAKNYGATIFTNIDEAKKWNTEHVSDINFRTKAVFGDIMRIKYNRVAKDPSKFSPPWASFLKMYDKRYYFACAPKDCQIFSVIADSFPFWDITKLDLSNEKLQGMEMFSYLPSNPNEKISNITRIDLYLRINEFSGKSENELKTELDSVINKIRTAYIEEDKDALLELWHPNCRNFARFQLFGNETTFKQSKQYFADASSFSFEFYVGNTNEMSVFMRRTINGSKEKRGLKILKFSREKGKLYATNRLSNPNAESIVESSQLAEFYYKFLNSK